jgi:hypothetical protein
MPAYEGGREGGESEVAGREGGGETLQADYLQFPPVPGPEFVVMDDDLFRFGHPPVPLVPVVGLRKS